MKKTLFFIAILLAPIYATCQIQLPTPDTYLGFPNTTQDPMATDINGIASNIENTGAASTDLDIGEYHHLVVWDYNHRDYAELAYFEINNYVNVELDHAYDPDVVAVGQYAQVVYESFGDIYFEVWEISNYGGNLSLDRISSEPELIGAGTHPNIDIHKVESTGVNKTAITFQDPNNNIRCTVGDIMGNYGPNNIVVENASSPDVCIYNFNNLYSISVVYSKFFTEYVGFQHVEKQKIAVKSAKSSNNIYDFDNPEDIIDETGSFEGNRLLNPRIAAPAPASSDKDYAVIYRYKKFVLGQNSTSTYNYIRLARCWGPITGLVSYFNKSNVNTDTYLTTNHSAFFDSHLPNSSYRINQLYKERLAEKPVLSFTTQGTIITAWSNRFVPFLYLGTQLLSRIANNEGNFLFPNTSTISSYSQVNSELKANSIVIPSVAARFSEDHQKLIAWVGGENISYKYIGNNEQYFSIYVENNTLSPYPNPFSSSINFKLEEASLIKLYNISGELILAKKLKAGTQILKTDNLANGIYFLKTNTTTFKVVKQ